MFDNVEKPFPIAWVERLYPALDNDIRLVLITFVLWLGFAVILVATARVKAAVEEEQQIGERGTLLRRTFGI